MRALTEPLNIDPLVLLMNGILFLVLLQVMSRLFWKPMMKHLESRKEEISKAYTTVDQTRREMDNLRSEYQGRLAAIEAEARGRIQETVLDAQHQREKMIADARAEAEITIKAGATAIEQEKVQTVISMREQLDDVAEQALARALGVPADAAQKKLVDDYIATKVVRS
jgi:F-type H+-transporting ATPase subunit b